MARTRRSPTQAAARVSGIGDGTRPDLLRPLLTASGALDPTKCQQLQQAHADNLTAAVAARSRELVVSSAERAWTATVRVWH